MSIKLFDTTLRDGAQREGVSLTAEDKARIARELDSLGLHYIEAGFPASNPKDLEFFEGFDASELENARLVAFTRARRPGGRAGDDPAVSLLARLSAPVACIVAKSWRLHVEKVLGTTPEKNLESVRDTVAYLAAAGKEVIFDAEHYFDGFREDPEHALAVLRAAAEAGATTLVLCDTNGGTLPTELKAVVARTVREFPGVEIGIHTHNDAGCGVANALAAVEAGATHVQGTINGVGERCGNCDLVTTIANLQLKMGLKVVEEEQLRRLTEVSNYVSEIMNITPDAHRPYVGRSAFAHKGGLHVDGISRDPRTYEHVAPELVGNQRRTPVGELSGKNSVRAKAAELGLEVEDVSTVLSAIKRKEHEGYHYEAADASLALLIQRTTGEDEPLFELESLRVISEKRAGGEATVEATIKLYIKGQRVISTAEGNGPVNALDRALRQAIEPHYPELKEIHLSNYKVRILDEHRATAATTRVLIDSTDGKRVWGAVGVGENIIEASWQALVDGLEYGINGAKKQKG
ncbi:2-isopropylmalate synthase [Rubrobacter xylanophilus DSM 9941]|uniref:Citramalate synthase n=1 Tax=Rubrobacter xylanophilus (strain DSM 9941 / JCM 11954 / NBRC 16129 / PRD-1) TaxID=266117 RepID=Q1ARE0_RUBXD|nr:citramalate synthase [Rubrobacter xylanophilus]ABG06038.1 2-isopropylmalate synthase [Rubrobacter xylanophilus DSM 9941]